MTEPPNPRSSNELQTYLDDPCEVMKTNPLKFWKDNEQAYPTLATIAKKTLSVPSSSAPVERLFSIAGKVFSPERCQLTDKTFEQLML